ncbi:hypothetical protein SYNPS1DRAFT_30262 [Syncephalis pseudoplumigaleata]|uniref:Uncharacterized protein n=1 Tax=Syncephalis pseudoplumigaleata TaxID=1712513 RepID=A0A4P9YVP0_9FUNG|nr:hypothetical protein SYNPS1DRAFT_30262 [Syncephalis pseudoplumigaleata]|eukprot:RKP23964.1 hypothetical protein SYNPS1DRAFT_30262 [Syncephalis pseudoplumigaleata]
MYVAAIANDVPAPYCHRRHRSPVVSPAWTTDQTDGTTPSTSITRMICILDAPVKAESSKVAIFTFPAHSSLGNKQAVAGIQLDPGAQACPDGYCKWRMLLCTLITGKHTNHRQCPSTGILYLWTATGDTTQSDLALCQQSLLTLPEHEQQESGHKPRALFVAQYTEQIRECITAASDAGQLPAGVYACSDPSAALDLDDAVKEAKRIFHSIAPDAEFLPRAPPAEDDGDGDGY